MLCMHPLDLLKVKFQVATEKPQGGVGRAIWTSLKDIQARDGWRGLYRGVSANIAGNASSWGFYFLLYVPPSLQTCVRSLCSPAPYSLFRTASSYVSPRPATTCSSSAHPGVIPIISSPRERTCYVLRKRVRMSILAVMVRPTDTPRSAC